MSLLSIFSKNRITIDHLVENFDLCFTNIKNILKDNTKNKYFDYELLAYLYSLSLIGLYQKKCQDDAIVAIADLMDRKYSLYTSDTNFYSKRSKLYMEILSGKKEIRAEWSLGNKSSVPIIKTFIAFGDILHNPECADNYSDAPILLPDIFEIANFANIMTNSVQPQIRMFTDMFRHLK